MDGVKDASHLYEVERRARHADGRASASADCSLTTQQVPWACAPNIQDTFYVLEGELRIFLRDPGGEVRLGPAALSVRPGRAHLVTNPGQRSATFLVLQGLGEYDYVPLTNRGQAAATSSG